jgi:hypothetical protein
VCTAPGSGTPLPGSGNICTDPKLNSSGEETTPSPTIDKGSNSLVPAGLTTDFEGHSRVQPGVCGGAAIVDMGAFEAGPQPCPPQSPQPPAPPGPTGPGTLTVGGVQLGGGGVVVGFSCAGGPAQVCDGDGSLYTTEHLVGKKVAFVTRKRRRKRTVLIGSAHFTLHGGQTLSLRIPLNPTGKRLLARFHRLPARLVVTVNTQTGKLTVTTRKLTIKQPRKHRRKRGR